MARRIPFAALVLALVWLFTAPTASAAPAIVFQTDMHGASMVPPVNTGVWGFVRFFFNETRSEADYTVDVKGTSAATGADMFKGAPGTNGTLVRHLAQASFLTFGGHLKLTATELQDFVAGAYYVVLYTSAHPDGEIRGQVYVPCGFIGAPAPGCTDPQFAGIPAPTGLHEVQPVPAGATPVDLQVPGAQPQDAGLPPGGVSPAPPPPPANPSIATRTGAVLPPNTGDGGLAPARRDLTGRLLMVTVALVAGAGLISRGHSRRRA